jgi:hypothetical protein
MEMKTVTEMRIDAKTIAIAGLVAAACIAVAMLPPMAQDPAYFRYADQRRLLGIPNFWNVLSNLPFVLLGLMGMISIARQRTPGYLPALRPIYLTFFAGVFLTGFGSAYYHLDPSNATIVWDRLALTLLFMSFFCTVWGEHISVSAALKMVWPLIAIGLASVVYWYVTETRGRGDLRFYAVVQFLPMVLLPLILLLYRSRMTGVGYLWGLLAAYAVAKAAEVLDHRIYDALPGFSGHEIKHWVAAIGVFVYYRAGFKRKRRGTAPDV